ncbi:tetratricopeptide repeat protein [Piscinibacter sp.]|uniref:tetratricopeptide repeat protein n=1 Tax=Piscinibacter sp. TaxID=1903157 RepID=UPI0039E2C5E2
MTRSLHRILALAATFWLAACAAPAPPAEGLFDDTLFAPPAQPVDAGAVFALSDAMRRYLDEDLAREVRRKGARAALIDALYAPDRLRLDYDAQRTRSAAEAFEARSGNCLSLVIMSAALARHLGLPVQFHSVHTDAGWGRSGDLLVSSGHVNLTLRHPGGDERMRFDIAEAMLIDFEPPQPGQKQYSRGITEATLLAMYMNNRAAESLAAGAVDDAYWFARAAIAADATFLRARNTLAVVYQRRGAFAQAARVLEQLLALEPANVAVLSNLANAYTKQGRADDAAAVQRRLARIEPEPPYHFFQLGLDAMQRRDYARAKAMFEKEIERAAYHHEFHFGLALASYGLGDVKEARRQLGLAMQASTRAAERELYAGKLERLKALRLQ